MNCFISETPSLSIQKIFIAWIQLASLSPRISSSLRALFKIQPIVYNLYICNFCCIVANYIQVINCVWAKLALSLANLYFYHLRHILHVNIILSSTAISIWNILYIISVIFSNITLYLDNTIKHVKLFQPRYTSYKSYQMQFSILLDFL